MERHCKKCGFLAVDALPGPDDKCPRCGTLYDASLLASAADSESSSLQKMRAPIGPEALESSRAIAKHERDERRDATKYASGIGALVAVAVIAFLVGAVTLLFGPYLVATIDFLIFAVAVVGVVVANRVAAVVRELRRLSGVTSNASAPRP